METFATSISFKSTINTLASGCFRGFSEKNA